MDRCPSADDLMALAIDGPEETAEVAAHLSHCDRCTKTVAGLRDLVETTAAWSAFQRGFDEVLTADAQETILQAARRAYSRSRWARSQPVVAAQAGAAAKVPAVRAAASAGGRTRWWKQPWVAFGGGVLAGMLLLVAALQPIQSTINRRGGTDAAPWLARLSLVSGESQSAMEVSATNRQASVARYAVLTSASPVYCLLFRVDSLGNVTSVGNADGIECPAVQSVVLPLAPPGDGISQEWIIAAFTESEATADGSRRLSREMLELIERNLSDILKSFERNQVQALTRSLNAQWSADPKERRTIQVQSWVVTD